MYAHLWQERLPKPGAPRDLTGPRVGVTAVRVEPLLLRLEQLAYDLPRLVWHCKGEVVVLPRVLGGGVAGGGRTDGRRGRRSEMALSHDEAFEETVMFQCNISV